MDYKEVLLYLNSFSRFGSRPGLTTIQYLLYLMGNPERELEVIHVAGTNGKGSVSSMLASGLLEAGYKVGLYTSPHLFSIRERIKIDGKEIDKDSFIQLTEEVIPYINKVASKDGCHHPTFFETLTAMAFLYFVKKRVDIVILETGMGGRFDATNVLYPLVSVITHIARDHTNFLGWKIENIAKEKCGIVKGGIPVVSTIQEKEAETVIKNVGDYMGSPVYFLEKNRISDVSLSLDHTTFTYKDMDGILHKVQTSLLGIHQAENAALALYTVEILKKHWDYKFPMFSFIDGLKEVNWPGRFQIISKDPYIIFDGAHNVDGIKRLIETLNTMFPGRKIKILTGILRDKEYDEMVRLLAPFASEVIVTAPKIARALPPFELKNVFTKYTDVPIKVIVDPEEAYSSAKRGLIPSDILLVTGSLYLIGSI